MNNTARLRKGLFPDGPAGRFRCLKFRLTEIHYNAEPSRRRPIAEEESRLTEPMFPADG